METIATDSWVHGKHTSQDGTVYTWEAKIYGEPSRYGLAHDPRVSKLHVTHNCLGERCEFGYDRGGYDGYIATPVLVAITRTAVCRADSMS